MSIGVIFLKWNAWNGILLQIRSPKRPICIPIQQQFPCSALHAVTNSRIDALNLYYLVFVISKLFIEILTALLTDNSRLFVL